MSLKNIFCSIFGTKCRTYNELYALQSKYINAKLTCSFWKWFSIYQITETKEIVRFPFFLGNLKRFFKKSDEKKIAGTLYEHSQRDASHLKTAEEKLKFILDLLAELNLGPESKIMDIGCAGGWYLRRLWDLGWKNLVGVEPSKASCDFLRKENDNIVYYNEYFGTGEHTKEKDVAFCLFNGSIDRIPYANDLSVLQKLKPRYIFILTSAFVENYPRNWDMELTKVGYYCLKKETVIIETDGAHKSLRKLKTDNLSNINSFYLFTRLPN